MINSILDPISRGVVGYFSYLSACGASTVYSEYLLYEPIFRIANAKRIKIICEFRLPKEPGKKGDFQRIDFDFRKENDEDERMGLEVKWIKSKTPNLKNDINKLIKYNEEYGSPGYLLLFGHIDFFDEIKLEQQHKIISKGLLRKWDTKKTNYAAQWFRIV